MTDWLTIAPPNAHAEHKFEREQWRVLRTDETYTNGKLAEVTMVGSRYFVDLRQALLYAYKQAVPVRILDVGENVRWESEKLEVDDAKLLIEDEGAQFLKALTDESPMKPVESDEEEEAWQFDPASFPDRLATLDDNQWHADESCRSITKSRAVALEVTVEDCKGRFWPCSVCMPYKRKGGDDDESSGADDGEAPGEGSTEGV